MNWTPFLISFTAGAIVGAFYGFIHVRSPAPPVIALLGLLGMVVGEATVSYLRGHPASIAQVLHLKSFAIGEQNKTEYLDNS